MSDLTNKIDELFGAPKEVEQEPVVEELVEEVQVATKKEYTRIDVSSLFEDSPAQPEPIQEEVVVVETPKKKDYVYKKLEKLPVENKKVESLKEESKNVDLSFSESIDQLFGIEKKKTTYSMLKGKKQTFIKEEVQPELVKPEKTRHQKNMERAGAALSLLESKKPKKTLIIKEDKSVEDRLALLEQDVFTQMSKGTPNTLVSGIGASLDSGGGAVWLWDLNDVNIGTPLNGTYPVINDNDVLKFDSATNKWIPGAPTVNSADLPLAGGTMTGDIVFNSSQTFPGTLELDGGTMTGDITFKAGQTFPGTLPLTGGAITGDTTYTGSTAGATNLQTKTSVNALISAAVTGGFVFKGTTNVTGAAPTPAAGDFYINTVAGTAANTWTGIAGLTVSADQLVIYSGAESRWFVGAVEDNTSFLAKTGGTMTGDIVFAGTQTFPSSITSGFLQKSGGTMTGTLTTDELVVPLGKTLTIKRGNNNTSSSGLDIKGYQPGQFTAQTDIFGVSYGNGTSTADSINYKGRTDGSNNLQTKSSVTTLINAAVASDGNLLNGGIIAASGGTANNSGNLTLQQENGSGDNSGTLFLKKYNTTDPTITLDPIGKITISTNSIGHIYLKGTGGGKFSVDNNRTFHFSDQLNDFMTLNAAELTLLSPALFTGSSFVVERGLPSGSNATNFVVKGMLSSSIGTVNSTLVSIKRSSGVGDTLQYFGNTTTNNNTVQTKGSVVGSTLFQNKSDNVGSTLTGFFLVEYKKGITGIVEVVMHAVDENNIVAGDIICVLPAGYRPAFLSDNTNGYCPVFTIYNNDFTISATCAVKPTGAITVLQVSGNSLTFQGQCVFSTLTPS